MSSAHRQPGESGASTASGSSSLTHPKKRLAEEFWIRVIEADPRICNNCFATREREERFFRMVGGPDRRQDTFCPECGAGTGEPDVFANATNVQTAMSKPAQMEAAGTIEREWGRDNPMEKRGGELEDFDLDLDDTDPAEIADEDRPEHAPATPSLAAAVDNVYERLMKRDNLQVRLIERTYDIDREQLFEDAMKLKDRWPNMDRQVLFTAVFRQLDAETRRLIDGTITLSGGVTDGGDPDAHAE